MDCTYTDLRPKDNSAVNYLTCPPDDRARNDERIQCLDRTASLLRSSYPTCSIQFFIQGQRLSGRLNEIKNATGIRQLKAHGNIKCGGQAWRDALTALDSLSQINEFARINKPVQPEPFPSTVPSIGSWSNMKLNPNGSWYIWPSYRPDFSISAKTKLEPASGTAIRLIIDSNILEGRKRALLQLVDMFEGNIQMTSLPEVVKELGRGFDGSRRLGDFAEIMRRKVSTTVEKGSVLASSRPIHYADNTPPKIGRHLVADRGITVELGKVIPVLERKSTTDRLVVIFITQDLGCSQLVRAVGASEAIFIPLRVEVDETGERFKDIVYNQLLPHLV
jgi:hypothetical protein